MNDWPSARGVYSTRIPVDTRFQWGINPLIPGINGFTRLRQCRWFLGLKSQVWALQWHWEEEKLCRHLETLMWQAVWWTARYDNAPKWDLSMIRLDSCREVQNIKHSLTCPSDRITTRGGMMCTFFESVENLNEKGRIQNPDQRRIRSISKKYARM